MSEISIHTAIIMFIGILGCIIPALPGPPLVFLGALYYSWRTDWAEVPWPVLVILFLIMMVGASSNFWLSYFGARKSGASVWSSVAAFFGGLIGMIVANLPGLFIGAIGAIALVEYYQHKDWNKVLKASKGYLVGYALSLAVGLFSCFVIIGIFLLVLRF